MADLEGLSMGAVFDVFIESSNDGVEYARVATQDDFNRF